MGALYLLMDGETQWGPNKMAAYIKRARGIDASKDIRSMLSHRLNNLITDHIPLVDSEEAVSTTQLINEVGPLLRERVGEVPLNFEAGLDGERADPMLRNLHDQVVVLPAGNEAGAFTNLVLLAKQNNVDWKLSDCFLMAIHHNLIS
jgi:hypothetical protein